MSNDSKRLKTWAAAVVVAAVGVLAAVIGGLATHLNATAAPLHPQPESAPSVTRSEPSPQ